MSTHLIIIKLNVIAMIDWSKYPQKIEKGETKYLYNGVWVTPIDLNSLSDSTHYIIEKVTHSGENDHKFASSKEAMIVGCYKFLEINEVGKKVPADVPGRFIARALYNKIPGQDYLNKIGGEVEVYVRMNPLLNRDSRSSWLEEFSSTDGQWPEKSLDNFRKLFLKKEIQIHQIEIEPNQFGSKSYVYYWDFL